MIIRGQVRRRWPKEWPLQIVPPPRWVDQQPTYREAQPDIIAAALERSQRRATGNWYVFAASQDVHRGSPFGATVAGVDVVAWRDRHQQLRVGPRTCPHLGADLATGIVHRGALICRWHGLTLDGDACAFGWQALPSYDDGVLAWVRLDSIGGESPSPKPLIPDRPTGETLSAVAHMVGVCEPSDIIANRLDPWHGAWFHPYSFAHLQVLTTPTEESDRFLVAVTFRVGRFGVPVIAEFTSPEARTIVMRIVDGEGTGSVVETHATPVDLDADGRPRCTVTEAVIAHSGRIGFKRASRAAPLLAPVISHVAGRLWRDDLAYAERRYHLRSSK